MPVTKADLRPEVVETDILCVGGGIAGLMAAIKASERGAKVTVVEKANTLRSGGGGMGDDHFSCFVPEVHGTVETALAEGRRTQLARRLEDAPKALVWFKKTPEIVELWNSWGIPMKYEGRYEFAGHRLPDSKYGVYLKYTGVLQKPVLTREALKRDVKIINRLIVFELLGDEKGVTGALGVDTRDDRLVEFRAKAVILGTGSVKRLYPGATPAYLNNLTQGLSASGDGRAMAYRLGAELRNFDTLAFGAGPRYFSRPGQGTWVGVYRDPDGNPIGPFLTKPDRIHSDMALEINRTVFTEYARSGKGPVYMDCRGISDADLKYMRHWLNNEGNGALADHLDAEGIDLRKTPIEFMTYGANCEGIINTSLKAETSIPGLYAAGEEMIVGVSGAAAFGAIAGEDATGYIKAVKAPGAARADSVLEEKRKFLLDICNREVGPGWKEVNIAIQQTMWDYAGALRTQTYLEAGQAHLQRLKERAYQTMTAGNQHELMRALETLNLFDLGEIIFATALERKETRGNHKRADYPYTNPMMDKLIIIKKVNGKPAAEWRDKGY